MQVSIHCLQQWHQKTKKNFWSSGKIVHFIGKQIYNLEWILWGATVPDVGWKKEKKGDQNITKHIKNQ